MMYFTGFADEASSDFATQVAVTKQLGWRNLEARKLFDSNLAFLSDAQFDEVCRVLAENDVSINCFGSGIANWQKPITEPPDSSYDELRRAVPRLQKLGTKLVRIMSFSIPEEFRSEAWRFEEEVLRRLEVMVRMAEDAGLVLVHENCMNWGGLSFEHTLRLCERLNSPAFRLVFDTGNPVFNLDRRGSAPHTKYQSSWEFYRAVRDFVAYIHIKDAKMGADGNPEYTFCGEGDGDVEKILRDLLARGYDSGISIEPHMAVVFHDANVAAKEEFCIANYVEYGRRLELLVGHIRQDLAAGK